MAATASAQGLQAKANFSKLFSNERFADVTLTLRVRPAEPPPPSPSQQQGEKEKAHVMGMERSATGDVTMRLNSTVLVQRSSYFEGLLDGAGTANINLQQKLKLKKELISFQRQTFLSLIKLEKDNKFHK